MTTAHTATLSDAQFKKICKTVYSLCGIHLQAGKHALVRSRLMTRLRKLEMSTFQEYLDFVESPRGSSEIGLMVDALTTNKTSFFREKDHFTYLSDSILPLLNQNRVRIWSAACSSGEEPYSIAILLKQKMPNIDSHDIRILATDISYDMLARARRAVYAQNIVADMPRDYVSRSFEQVANNGQQMFHVRNDVRKLVHLAWLNLMDRWPMKGPFDVIFCRNVMIYFDKKTKQDLINRFWDFLAPGAHLFVGHSEGLTGITHRFQYIKPAVYRK